MNQIPEGYKVEYEHHRNILMPQGIFVPTRFPTKDPVLKVGLVHPHGGRTFARILDANGNLVAVGEAQCSPKDNYNKTIGRQISLGRALKNL